MEAKELRISLIIYNWILYSGGFWDIILPK